jgi:hypothetical protein
MTNATYSSTAFKRAAAPANTSLLRELFAATPLYIFFTAVKTAFAKR